MASPPECDIDQQVIRMMIDASTSAYRVRLHDPTVERDAKVRILIELINEGLASLDSDHAGASAGRSRGFHCNLLFDNVSAMIYVIEKALEHVCTSGPDEGFVTRKAVLRDGYIVSNLDAHDLYYIGMRYGRLVFEPVGIQRDSAPSQSPFMWPPQRVRWNRRTHGVGAVKTPRRDQRRFEVAMKADMERGVLIDT